MRPLVFRALHSPLQDKKKKNSSSYRTTNGTHCIFIYQVQSFFFFFYPGDFSRRDMKVAGVCVCVFFSVYGFNLNLMPLKKIIYCCVNNVKKKKLVKEAETLGVKLSRSWTLSQ